MLSWKWRAWTLLTFLLFSSVDSKCCNKKVVPGLSGKAGTYILVSNSDSVPDFCLGGCVYTKEDDPLPGSNYCFKDGDMSTTCSGGGCGTGEGGIEGWIEKYFKKECSAQINSVISVQAYKSYGTSKCGSSQSYGALSNLSFTLFYNSSCDGIPSQTGVTNDYSNRFIFLVRVQNSNPWSILVSKDGFKSKCKNIGIPIPFQNNYESIYIDEEQTESIFILYGSLNFTFDINNDLLSDVFVLDNPQTCYNYTFFPFRNSFGKSKLQNGEQKNKKTEYMDYDFFMKNPETMFRQGSGSGYPGSGSNYQCYPTCIHASWNTDPSKTPCQCKGTIGGGINFTDITLPNLQNTAGKASMEGSIYWYDDGNPLSTTPRFYLAFAEFDRRNNTSIRVCESNLTLSLHSKFVPTILVKTVPCFDAQIPPTTPNPTFPTYPYPGGSGFPTFSPLAGTFPPGSGSSGASGAGSSAASDSGVWPTSYPQWLSTTNSEELFSEVDGVLIWGNGDRYWIFGCSYNNLFISLKMDFFTAKDPKDTPLFCGCLLSTLQSGNTEASKEQVKECYVKALDLGPSTGTLWARNGLGNKGKRTLNTNLNKKSKNIVKRLKKKIRKLKGLNGKPKKENSMKNFIQKMQKKRIQHLTGRLKREVNYGEMDDESEFAENIFNEEEFTDDEMEMNFENDFDKYDHEEDYNMGDDANYDDYGDNNDYSLSSDW